MGKAIKALKLLLAEIDVLDELNGDDEEKKTSYLHSNEETEEFIDLMRNIVKSKERELNGKQ